MSACRDGHTGKDSARHGRYGYPATCWGCCPGAAPGRAGGYLPGLWHTGCGYQGSLRWCERRSACRWCCSCNSGSGAGCWCGWVRRCRSRCNRGHTAGCSGADAVTARQGCKRWWVHNDRSCAAFPGAGGRGWNPPAVCRRASCLPASRCRRSAIPRRAGCPVYSGSPVPARCTHVWSHAARAVLPSAGDAPSGAHRSGGLSHHTCNAPLPGALRWYGWCLSASHVRHTATALRFHPSRCGAWGGLLRHSASGWPAPHPRCG